VRTARGVRAEVASSGVVRGLRSNCVLGDVGVRDEGNVDAPLTRALLDRVERALGSKLPAAYVELMRTQNGGIPRRTRPTSWSANHVALTGIYAIGEERPCSLCGDCGSKFWPAEWGYPDIGVDFADCPAAGHDMFCLDYRHCGPMGEPTVVHVDQERDYKITVVSPTFESFIRGLQGEQEFDAS
jgi:hypothetical protein